MNYLSTGELARRWGVSPRQITKLALKGRIEGAKQVDGRWFIPEDAEKPGDPRKSTPKTGAESGERYCFPFLLACVHSEEQVRDFTPGEKELYRLCLLYEAGEFLQARELAERLLSSENRYIRLGALFHLPTVCMYLMDFAATEKYAILFRTACHDCPDHKAELALLVHELDSELVSMTEFTQKADNYDVNLYPDSLLPFISSWLLLSEITKLGQKGTLPNITYHEIACRNAEQQGYYFSAAYMHCGLSAYYGAKRVPDKEHFHMKRAIDIALEHGTVFTLAYSLTYNPVTCAEILQSYPPEVEARFRRLSGIFVRARNAYAEYQGNALILSRLTESDYRVISFCLKGYSIEMIAAALGLSESGTKKRLAILYDKLGVKSKNEMARVFLHSLLDWGKA